MRVLNSQSLRQNSGIRRRTSVCQREGRSKKEVRERASKIRTKKAQELNQRRDEERGKRMTFFEKVDGWSEGRRRTGFSTSD